MICLHMNWKAHTACNVNFLFENGHFKATVIHCKYGNISETVTQSLLLQTTNRKWYMAYQIVAIPMTLSHFQGHSLLQAFQIWFFVQLYSSWQVISSAKILTDCWFAFTWHKSTRPCIPAGSLSRVPALAWIKGGCWMAGSTVWSHMACGFPVVVRLSCCYR